MSTENTEGVSQPEPSQSFADAYAGLIGDLSHVPDSELSDAPEPDTPTPARSEEVEAAAPAGDPPVEAAPSTSDEVAPAEPVDPEPIAATYRVNGEDRTFDGIKVYPDKSGLIPSEQMDAVLHRLSERDHLFESSQQRQQELTALQTEYQQSTSWKLDDGRIATGREGAQAKDMAYALARAERDAYDSLLSEPAEAFKLFAQDAQGNITWNSAVVDLFKAKLDNNKIRLENAVRQHYAARPQLAVATPSAPSAMPAPAAVADHLVSLLGIKNFGAEDKQWIASLAEDMVRPATAKDVAADPTARLGEPYAPPKLIALIKDRVAVLGRSAKTVESATAAERENRAKLDAAQRGKKPVTAAPIARAEAAPQKSSQDERWERENGAAANLLRSATLQTA